MNVLVFDSGGKFPPSMFDGTLTDLGNYDQCLRVKAMEDTGEVLYHGKYCLAKLHLAIPPRKSHLKYTDKIYNYTNTPLQGGVSESQFNFNFKYQLYH